MASNFAGCKALVFDLMGTCCNWEIGIVQTMQELPKTSNLDADRISKLALEWRAGFFQELHQRFEQGLPQEHIDATHSRVLDRLLERLVSREEWGDDERRTLVAAWHDQKAWPDAFPALQRLRKHFFAVVLANGTTRLQLDIAKSSGLPFHMLFSSQLLGMTKPDPAIYRKAAELMGLRVDECIMVAAHVYDLKVAKSVGMRTVYVRRTTEDIGEDFDLIGRNVDLFLDGRNGSVDCGLALLAAHLEAEEELFEP
jgi:2-haloalkanoic acid dehalogenase type II